ncbi:AraC family transcriptional regulator [Streptosporangium sp. CA-135522]|uniref:AraC family transcriptional regulator n=1 Tax=Streptosporangium sp. CA-135522 TaxID=3240072 RepID=UPI003D9448F7
MDVIGDLLDGVRTRGAVFRRSPACPVWSLRFVAPGPLSLVTVVGGQVWVAPQAGGARALRPGDVALAYGGRPFTIAGSPVAPGPPHQVLVHGVEHPVEPDPVEPVGIAGGAAYRVDGAAEWGGGGLGGEDGEGEPVRAGVLLVTGACRPGGRLCRRLLGMLPDLLVVPGGDARLGAVLELIGAEVVGSAPGRRVVLDRLLDVLVVVALRAWFAREEAHAPGWYTALEDPRIGRALREIHRAPEAGWTVVGLAAAAGMSRAAFARRFTELVGRPPLAYLTEWRMALAAELLARPGTTVAQAARRVGYADAFGFSAAFKRVRGVSPGTLRAGG